MTAPAYLDLPGFVDDRAVIPLAYDFTSPEAYTIVDTTGAALTVTRSGATGTRFNSLGVLETIAADTPRWDYDPITLAVKGLLIERARTNVIRNNTMQAAVAGSPGTVPTNWTNTSGTAGVVTRTIIGVGQEQGIDYIDIRYQFSGAGTASVLPELSTIPVAASGQIWTGSAYTRLVGGSLANLAFSIQVEEYTAAGAFLTNSSSVHVPTAAALAGQRHSHTRTLNNASTARTGMRILFNASGAADATLRIGLPQLELTPLASSVIRTTGAAATRSADNATVPTGSWFNAAEGTLFAEYSVRGIPAAGNVNIAVAFDDGTTNEAIHIRTLTVAVADAIIVDGGVVVVDTAGAAITAGPVIRSALAYKLNDCAASINGGAVQTDAAATMPTVTTLRLGNSAANSFLDGWLRRVVYFPKRLANATLPAISLSGPTIVFNDLTAARRREVLGLPEIPKDTPSGLRRFLTKMKETFEVRTAQVGSPLDSNPTYRDLITAGLIKVDPNVPLTASGRQFTLDTTSWITSNLPSWLTDNTNPPTPSGLAAAANTANIVLFWDTPVFSNYSQTLVYRASENNLSEAELIGSNSGNTYVDDLPPFGTVYWYWIRHQAKNQLLSDFNDVNGVSTSNVPSAPTVSYEFSGDQVVVSWVTPTSNLAIQYYIISYGSVVGQTVAGISQSSSFRFVANFGGSRTYWVQAVDINDGVGAAGSVDVTVVSPAAPNISQVVVNGSLALSYASIPGSLPIAHYEVRYGADWASGVSLGTSPSTRLELAINWSGSRTFHVGAYDTAGNLSATSFVVFSPTIGSVSALTAQVIDNNVLLRWSSTAGTLPIATFNVYRDGVLVGANPAQFSVLFETVSDTYSYTIEPVDTAGNVGTSTTISAVVSQPPDFVLYDNQNSEFSGTKTTTFLDASTGTLYVNVDATETFEDHFTARGWTTPQDQIDAGYPLFLVGSTTGSYLETVDYGATIPSTKILMSPTEFFSSGTVTSTPTISTSPDDITYTDFAGVWAAYASAFRYVKFNIDFTAAATGTGLATDTTNLLGINPLNYTLDVKLKTAQGVVTCASGDVGGTVVDISSSAFIDVHSIVLTPLSTAARIATYDFVDIPNPTEFKAFLWSTAGARQSGDASYTIRGV